MTRKPAAQCGLPVFSWVESTEIKFSVKQTKGTPQFG